MDIEGFGEKQAYRFLVEEELIGDPADIYDLTEERLVELEGFGEVSARNLVARSTAPASARSGPCCSRSACPGSAT